MSARALEPLPLAARLQELMLTHQERLKQLSLERQQIVHSQAMYLGHVEPVPQARKDAASLQVSARSRPR